MCRLPKTALTGKAKRNQKKKRKKINLTVWPYFLAQWHSNAIFKGRHIDDIPEKCKSFHHGRARLTSQSLSEKNLLQRQKKGWISLFQNWPSLLYLLWVHVIPALLAGPGEKEEAAEASVSSRAASEEKGAAARAAWSATATSDHVSISCGRDRQVNERPWRSKRSSFHKSAQFVCLKEEEIEPKVSMQKKHSKK